MNPEELLRMMQQAGAALRMGADPAAVDQRVAQMTGGQFTTLAEVGPAVMAMQQEARQQPEQQAMDRLASDGGNALSDFARMAGQGLTFGFGDELAGMAASSLGKDYTEARDASRQRVDDLRATSPGASMMGEIAGGVGVPLAGGVKLARSLAGPHSSVIRRAGAGAAAGAATGGVGGGLFGLGESRAEDAGGMARDAGIGAALGGTAGGVLGGALPAVGAGVSKGTRFLGEVLFPESQGANEASRRLQRVFAEAGVGADDIPRRMDALGPEAVIADIDPRLAREARAATNQAATLDRAGGPVQNLRERTDARGERMARALREASGISESMQSGQEAARRVVREVREQHYHALEQAFPEVDGDAVAQALRDPRVAAVARRIAPKTVASEDAVARVVAQGVPEEQARALVKGKPPSFMELQDMMMDLRDEVTSARAAGRPNASRKAQEAFELLTGAMEQDIPGFGEAQNAFHIASKKLEGYENGFKAWTGSAREIQEAMAELPVEAHDSFRAGLIQRWEEKLLTKEGTSGAVNSILRAGSDMREQIRAAFGSDEGFSQFLRQRDLERTFRLTEGAVQGNSTTIQQGLDALDSAPASKSQLLNRIYEAVLSPGESRRTQATAVGEQLLGRDVDALRKMLQTGPFNIPGAGGGLSGMTGSLFGGAASR